MAQFGQYVLAVDGVEYDFETAPTFIKHKVRKLTELYGTDFDLRGTPGSRVHGDQFIEARNLARKWGVAHPQ